MHIDLPGRRVAIRERADHTEVWVADDTLHVARRTSRRQGRVVLSLRQNLREASIGADLAGQRTSFSVGGWDPSTKEAIDVEADVSALASERAGGGTAGSELLQQAFGDRPERVVHTVPLGPDEARKVADAQIDRAKQEAETERQRRLEDTRKQIEAETTRAIGQIRSEVADLTIEATERVVGKVLDAEDQRRLVQEAVQGLDFSALEGSKS